MTGGPRGGGRGGHVGSASRAGWRQTAGVPLAGLLCEWWWWWTRPRLPARAAAGGRWWGRGDGWEDGGDDGMDRRSFRFGWEGLSEKNFGRFL